MVEMAYAARPRYSKTQVRKAGNVLSGDVGDWPADKLAQDELTEWFNIAHNWRASHIVPMRFIRAELSRKARKQDASAVSVARLKRMQSIRRKLPSRALHQIQDIAGCRAIFPTSDGLNAALAVYKAGESKHEWARDNDYINEPKLDGYRSYHFVLRFCGPDAYEPYDGLLVEIQLRTRMQHAWATAVEAVGLYRNENLKGGEGDPQWLRLLQLMSSEIALSEGLPLVPGTSQNDNERRQEIAEICKQVSALETLAGFRRAVKETENRFTTAKYYLIQYDNVENRPIVTPYDDVLLGSSEYDAEELKNDPKNAVLVEVDKVEDLREAYPNYFLDVAAFESGLRRVLNGDPFGLPVEPPRPASSFNLASILQGWNARRKRRTF